jgi:hypothetical protein
VQFKKCVDIFGKKFLHHYTCEKYTGIITKVYLQITHTGTLVKSVPVLKKIENKSVPVINVPENKIPYRNSVLWAVQFTKKI